MYLNEANRILREAIVNRFFIPELKKLGFSSSKVKHPYIDSEGLSKDKLINLFFDLETGCDYPDGDEWFIVEYIVSSKVNIPDELKSADYFSTLTHKDVSCWRHRELIRYKYGKTKKLQEALEFINSKADELHNALTKYIKSK
ncbi:MAG: hypothetical protein QXX95_06030 [Nitrososphaerales archaeon]